MWPQAILVLLVLKNVCDGCALRINTFWKLTLLKNDHSWFAVAWSALTVGIFESCFEAWRNRSCSVMPMWCLHFLGLCKSYACVYFHLLPLSLSVKETAYWLLFINCIFMLLLISIKPIISHFKSSRASRCKGIKGGNNQVDGGAAKTVQQTNTQYKICKIFVIFLLIWFERKINIISANRTWGGNSRFPVVMNLMNIYCLCSKLFSNYCLLTGYHIKRLMQSWL